jgi:hypothetical protein
VAQACEAAPVSRVAGQRGLPPETVRRMDERPLRPWAAARPRTPVHYPGVDEIFLGQAEKFLTVVSDLETGEPLWVGRERKQETLDRFFADALPPARRRAVRAVCVDMWEQLELHLRGRRLPLPPQVAPRPPLAAVAGVPKAGRAADAASGRDP